VTKPAAVRSAQLLKSRLNRFTRALDGLEQGDVAALHKVRVASRRMRELVPVLQLDPHTARKLSRRLRRVTTRLGSVRELDVLLLLIDELHVSRPVHQQALRRVRAAVVRDREAARKRLRTRLSADDLRRLSRKLDRIVDELKQRQSANAPRKAAADRTAQWALDARVANRAARMHDAIVSAGAVYLPERLHDVRIAGKKLRYALELLEQSRGDGRSPVLAALKRVQGLLGRMHDLQVLMDRVREMQASLTPPSLAAWRELNDLVLGLEDMCRRLHARYVRERNAVETLTRKPRAERKVG
jgi:CHAD domain-containing protein